MAIWVETATTCPWSKFDDRLRSVNEVCCGAEADSVCPRGAPPRDCPPLCAVTFHAFATDCGETLRRVSGASNAERLTAFDELVRGTSLSIGAVT